ncbi:uncharacterized protein LOC105432640 [Pogonomyrmex barbatus]|uniref:Uncharacterized protein LOC105432640 n=1 Tax=Pogonomyrmex barbatus TaxID=144034 RepID=A0A8N1SBD2_9HYME|nr:uncharacterized protein LOC105432640 [Pogonomyrmex barbatus]
MYWKLFVSLLLHLLVCNSLARSAPYETVEDDVVAVGSLIREVRQPAPLKIAAEMRDLMSAGNTPKSQDNKKLMKNASGMFLCNMKNFIGTMIDTDYAGDENHDGASEYSHYTGSDDGDHYGNHYTEKEPESYSEKYSSGDGDEGSYEMHSSYSSDGEEGEGDHY